MANSPDEHEDSNPSQEQNTEAGWGEILADVGSYILHFVIGLLRFLLPPLDAFWGLAIGFVNFCSNPKDYLYISAEDRTSNYDRNAKIMPVTVGLGRVGATILAFLCILTMIGAIASPIPGATAVVGLGWLAVLKALGISCAYTAGARLVGGLIGSVIDCVKINLLITKAADVKPKNTSAQQPKSKHISYKFFGISAIGIGLGGENAHKIYKGCRDMISEMKKSSKHNSNGVSKATSTGIQTTTSLRGPGVLGQEDDQPNNHTPTPTPPR